MDKEYKAFIKQAQRLQRAYIKDEAKRMDKAERLLWKYEDAMRMLGLHPHSRDEIRDRRQQLSDMLVNVAETHGDSPVMRFSFESARRGSNAE